MKLATARRNARNARNSGKPSNAYEAGNLAAYISDNENPYFKGSADAAEWDRGHSDGLEEIDAASGKRY